MRPGYSVKRIKDICNKGSSNVAQKDLGGHEGEYPIYGASGFIKNVDFYHQEKEYVGIVKDGSGIGRVDFYPPKSSLIGTLQYIIPKAGYDIRYVGYCLQSLDLASYRQGAAIPHIYFRDYGEREVIVAEDISEQQRIVDFLNTEFNIIDALKERAEKSIQIVKELFQSSLYSFFKPNGRCLGDALNLRRGHDLTHGQMKTGIIPVAGSGGIIGYHNEATPISPCITVGRSGSVGKVYIYERCWAHNTVLYVDDFKGNNPLYLRYLLQSLDLESKGGGSAVPTLNRNFIHPLEVGYTNDLNQQAVVVDTLNELTKRCDSLITNYSKTLALCDDLKQALLRKAFYGEL